LAIVCACVKQSGALSYKSWFEYATKAASFYRSVENTTGFRAAKKFVSIPEKFLKTLNFVNVIF